jgi:transposase
MRTEYFITLDTHCRTSDACVKTRLGKLVRREHLPTTIPHLLEFIDSVPRPRRIAFEEGPLAGWLYRNLCRHAEELVVCDPRRNAHIAKDGDKDDPIDAEKLNDLYRGGFLRAVHQLDSGTKAGFKQLVGAYHDRVAHRVGEGNRLMGLGRRWGVLLSRAMLMGSQAKTALKEKIKAADAPACVVEMIGMLHDGFIRAAEQEQFLRDELAKAVMGDELMKRLTGLPGYGPVRAATLVAYLDTPWRFKSKSALWKYVGIGLRREKSGEGLNIIRVEQQCNRLLRNIVIGAAQSAIEQKENVFARRYARWIESGVSPRNARRNLARLETAAAWAMWKTGQAFRPEWISAEAES